jgi:hypothetical protein
VQKFSPEGHDQPLPAIETNAKPEGTVSITVSGALVACASGALLTVTVYVAPSCPLAKFPVWVFVMLNDGLGPLIIVLSLAVALAEPPPVTPTWLTWGEVAFDLTWIVTVIAG